MKKNYAHKGRKRGSKPTLSIISEPPSSKNNNTERRYYKIKLLGKGGFARVYKVKELGTKKKYAMKVIDKTKLKERNQRKLKSEIKIHSALNHKNICKFNRYFEDEKYVYFLLEICTAKTLMELMNSKKRLSELEAKFFLKQILDAMKYMHENRYIHRDIKLGNLFLTSDMQVKIGDFGLAAELEYDTQRKRTLCGTPNYIAPEILSNSKKGHSYEVDVWSLGVVLYTFLVGKPPFETISVKRTYKKIKSVNYTFPSHPKISRDARELIEKILQSDPQKRPTIFEMEMYPFFTREKDNYLVTPKSLFSYAFKLCKKYPRVDGNKKSIKERVALGEVKKNQIPSRSTNCKSNSKKVTVDKENKDSDYDVRKYCGKKGEQKTKDILDKYDYLFKVHNKLEESVNKIYEYEKKNPLKKNNRKKVNPLSALTPPSLYIDDFIDFSEKYGLTFRYNNGIVGAFYNDYTMILFNNDTSKITYFVRKKNRNKYEKNEYTISEYPEDLRKKVVLIQYFKERFDKKYGSKVIESERGSNYIEENVFVKMYLKTNDAFVFRLSNKIVQVRFNDGSEIVLSSEAKLVTYKDRKGGRETFALSEIALNPPSYSVAKRLKYTKNILAKLISK